ncbi:HAMP domain-containing protein [Nocardiopsis sp. CNT-189]|uniref:sensor histidine kinase n=1 Tax=Nocardiopsis oceanisediminis TaxID=2816862 RepID=UPI003B36751E
MGSRIRALPKGAALTVRTRLALVYAGVFLAAGVLLLALNYATVSAGLIDHSTVVTAAPLEGTAPGEAPPFMPAEPVRPDPGAAGGPDAGEPIAAELALSMQDYRAAVLRDLLLRSGAGLVAVTALAAFAGWLVAGRLLRRLHRVTETARRLSEHDLDRRLALTGPADEFRELGDTFDGMLERLQHAFESQRRFVANASHELRTPLAVQRAAVEIPLSQGRVPPDLEPNLRRVLESAEQSERLVAGLLLLARSDRGLEAAEPVDLAGPARRVLAAHREAAAERGVRLRAAERSAVVLGDRVLLEHLVRNLVDNAVRYNAAGGSVRVGVAAEGGSAVVRVENTGPEVAEAGRLFEPFHRGGRGRERTGEGGSGLGLSIVASIAAAHGGAAAAAPRRGGGLAVTVRLPLHAPDREDPAPPERAGALPAGGG